MARQAKPLTDKIIRDAIKGVGKRPSFPLYDGGGLHLIDRSGNHHWRLKYIRPDGRENRLALGHYPEVSLAEARALAAGARAKVRAGIDPAAARKADKTAARAVNDRRFGKLAQGWLDLKTPGWSPITARKNRRAVEAYLLPRLGKLDAATISTSDVLPIIREANEHSPEFARAAAGAAQNIVRFAIAEGKREEGRLLDLDLRHNLPGRQRGHNPSAKTPKVLTRVLDVIRSHENPVVRAALLVSCYTAQRPINTVRMRWDQIDEKENEWAIPDSEMKIKTGEPHLVPLPRQVIALLEELRPLTGGRGFVFPPVRQQHTPHLHRDSLSKALRDGGLRGIQTPHGLRATLRTMARERLGVFPDVLEVQLAHGKKDEVDAAYNDAKFVDMRHAAMQKWADYLDRLSREKQ
jgi:integrase